MKFFHVYKAFFSHPYSDRNNVLYARKLRFDTCNFICIVTHHQRLQIKHQSSKNFEHTLYRNLQ